VDSTLAEFQETTSQDAFALQNHKLLKVSLDQVTIQAKLGSMVAYQGDVKFEHAGSGGMGKLLKKTLTGEGTKLMKMSGSGEVFLAVQAQDVHLLRIDNDELNCNGANLLAFDAGIDWDIKRVEGASGMMSGGLFNVTLKGTGQIAVVSDGPPVLLQTSGTATFADPQAAIVWSSGVKTSVKTDIGFKTLTGRGSGESVQMAFSGDGWVLVQPSEGRIETHISDSNKGGGGLSGILSGLGN
jgi:uncharacterized protein (AIM24 family)